jgi:hypothetical protein
MIHRFRKTRLWSALAVAVCSAGSFGVAAGQQAGAEAPRAARSVHLRYPAPEGTAFYNEVTVDESVPSSYFMACGFRHGYFGIQEFAPGRPRRVLFSIWDPGDQNDPNSVKTEERVEVLYNAPDVTVRRFGGEGTGGQSFFAYEWKPGETYRFLVKATPEGNKTAFAAYFRINETGQWKHLVTFRTITSGKHLSNYYSFIEDFRRDGKSPHERRSGRFGNGWVQTAGGEWTELTTAIFTADPTPLDNIDAGARDGVFYMATGGETVKKTELKSEIQRPAAGRRPADLP